ncbi:MAG: hypothetical protein IPM57_00900 [Oligoflexia bacterium]|nr:hypothetical protein [Oligoflexia bacterium]
MFKNILTVAVVTALSVTAFAKAGRVVESKFDRTQREQRNNERTGLVKSTVAELNQVKSILGKNQRLLNALQLKTDALARISVETANVLALDSAKAEEAIKLAEAKVFDNELGQKGLASALQTLAYTAGVRPAQDVISMAEGYKEAKETVVAADGKSYSVFEVWVMVEREMARTSKLGTYKGLETMNQSLAVVRSILRGGSADVDFNKLADREKAAIKDLASELRRNRCLSAAAI